MRQPAKRLLSAIYAGLIAAWVVDKPLLASEKTATASPFAPLARWTELATSANVTAVAFAGGRYLAGTDYGTFLTSVDGSKWEHLLLGGIQTASMNGLVYAQGHWVAVGARGQITTSPDGVAWTGQWSGTDSHLHGVSFGNGRFVVVGGGPSFTQVRTILTSSNSVNWTVRELSVNQPALWKASFEHGMFVAAGNSGTLMTSAEGRTWSFITNLTRGRLSGIAYANGQFVVAGDGGIYASTNGLIWSTNRLGSLNIFDVAFGGDRFVATGNGTRVWTSTNGLNWSLSETGSASPLSVITYGGNRFVAGGHNGTIAVSTNGLQWEIHASGANQIFQDVALGLGRMAAVNSGSLMISADGARWQTPPSLVPYGIYNVSFAGGQFIAFGVERANPLREFLVNSLDGINWNLKKLDLLSTPEKVVFGNGLYVGVRDHFFVSRDGKEWTVTGAPAIGPLFGLAYGSNKFVAVRNARVYTSTNGTNWATNELSALELADVAYGNGIFLAVGRNGFLGPNVAAVSNDGINWKFHVLPIGANGDFTGITFGGGWFIAFGPSGAFLSSRDGITWNSHDSGSLSAISSVAYANGRFIAVGNGGVVLESGSLLPFLKISKQEANGINIVVAGSPNQVFAIESTVSLGSPIWNELGRATNAAPESVFVVAVTSDPNRFYRIRVIE